MKPGGSNLKPSNTHPSGADCIDSEGDQDLGRQAALANSINEKSFAENRTI